MFIFEYINKTMKKIKSRILCGESTEEKPHKLQKSITSNLLSS